MPFQVNLPLTFGLAQSAPFGTNSARVVLLGYNVVMVGGGNADIDNVQRVMYYQWGKGWGTLGKYNNTLFAMAVLGGGRRLVLIGGYNQPQDTYSNEIVHWDNHGKRWLPIYIPMPTARSDAAALAYKQYLLVAGGCNSMGNLTTVEVLNTETVQWSTVAPLPVPIEGLIQSTSHIDSAHPQSDTWYLMGWERGLNQPPNTFRISIRELIQQAKGELQWANWVKLPDPPLSCCSAVVFRGCLFAVGGKDQQNVKKKDIHLYMSGTCQWLCVAELPTPRHSCSCCAFSSEEFMVIGGCENTGNTMFSTRVDLAHV